MPLYEFRCESAAPITERPTPSAATAKGWNCPGFRARAEMRRIMSIFTGPHPRGRQRCHAVIGLGLARLLVRRLRDMPPESGCRAGILTPPGRRRKLPPHGSRFWSTSGEVLRHHADLLRQQHPPRWGRPTATIACDVLARYHRLRGDDVLFTTGTDEHAVRVLRLAEEAGMTPQEWVDPMAAPVPRGLASAQHLLRRLHPHHRAAPAPRGAALLRDPLRERRPLPRQLRWLVLRARRDLLRGGGPGRGPLPQSRVRHARSNG